MPKLRGQVRDNGPIPVNLECGNFTPPHLTRWDEAVDRSSENPGEQRFEKAVSGAYLGRIFKAARPQTDFNPESGAEGVVQMLESVRPGGEDLRVARAIYRRSADLVAASVAGLIQAMATFRSVSSVTLVAEGGLFWGGLQGRHRYRDAVLSRLDALLAALGLHGIHVRILRIEDANLIGSAVAALAGSGAP